MNTDTTLRWSSCLGLLTEPAPLHFDKRIWGVREMRNKNLDLLLLKRRLFDWIREES